MSLKHFIDRTSQKQANSVFRNFGLILKSANANCGGLAKVIEIKDGKYIVELADKSRKEIDPSGIRGVGPDGIILLSGDVQIL